MGYATGAWAQLAQTFALADAALVGEGESGAEGGQLVDGMVERQPLGSRHAIALTTRLVEIANLPHPGIIPRMV